MNKKAGISWEMVALIIAVIILIILIGIVYFTKGTQSELLASLKRIMWFT